LQAADQVHPTTDVRRSSRRAIDPCEFGHSQGGWDQCTRVPPPHSGQSGRGSCWKPDRRDAPPADRL